MAAKPTIWRKLVLRFATGLSMVVPSMAVRIALNRLRGVKMGRNPWIGGLVYLDIHHSHPDARNAIVMGDGVAIGNSVAVYTHSSLFHLITEGREPVEFGYVRIGDHVNVSPNSFLYNCKIGSHSIVAPGAIVTGGEYPPYSLIAGNPAKVVKDLRARVERSRNNEDAVDAIGDSGASSGDGRSTPNA